MQAFLLVSAADCLDMTVGKSENGLERGLLNTVYTLQQIICQASKI